MHQLVSGQIAGGGNVRVRLHGVTRDFNAKVCWFVASSDSVLESQKKTIRGLTGCLQRPALCAQEENHGQENWGGLQFYHRSLDQHHSDRGYSRGIAQLAGAQRRIRVSETGRSGALRWCRVQHIRRKNSLLETSETRPDLWLFRQSLRHVVISWRRGCPRRLSKHGINPSRPWRWPRPGPL